MAEPGPARPKRFDELTEADLLGLLGGEPGAAPPMAPTAPEPVVDRRTYTVPGSAIGRGANTLLGAFCLGAGLIEALYVLVKGPAVVAVLALPVLWMGWALLGRAEREVDTHVTLGHTAGGTLVLERRRGDAVATFTLAPTEAARVALSRAPKGPSTLLLVAGSRHFELASGVFLDPRACAALQGALEAALAARAAGRA